MIDRSWLDLRTSLQRMMDGRRPPLWALAFWKVQYLWKVRRAEIVCSMRGHRWSRDRHGVVCLRCARGVDEV